MATVTLTARYLNHLKSHGKRYEVFDSIVPGLAIRVSASGRKTFTLYYRHRRRMRRVGLGRYPDVLLEKARKIATQHRGRIFNGADPAGEKQTEHAQDDNTVQALYELYRSRKEKVLRSWSEVRRILEKEVLPSWRHRPEPTTTALTDSSYEPWAGWGSCSAAPGDMTQCCTSKKTA